MEDFSNTVDETEREPQEENTYLDDRADGRFEDVY